MSDTKQNLEILFNHYAANRIVGHTTAMLHGAYNDRTPTIVVHSEGMRKHVQQKIAAMHAADGVTPKANVVTLEGLRTKVGPILLDNCLMHCLLGDALQLINELQDALDCSLHKEREAAGRLQRIWSICNG